MNSESIKKRGGRPSLAEVLAQVDEEVQLFHSSFGGFPRAVEADQILRQIWLDDVHNSTAIEGNTMTRAQVKNVVENRRATGDLAEALDVRGYAGAADWVYRQAPKERGVPTKVVAEIHRRALSLAWELDPPPTRDRPGAWRTTGVRIGRVRVSLPPAIPADLDDWSRSTRTITAGHPIIHVAEHHAWFERIHPFVDGNGRVGRLILNFMLIQNGYPPAVILASQRARYLRALRAADEGNPNPLAEVIARATSATLTRFLIPNLAGDAKLIPLAALATKGPYSAVYLRQLVIRGRLRAVKDGNIYLSSRAWLNAYVNSRDPRGGKPKGKPPRAPSRASPRRRRRE